MNHEQLWAPWRLEYISGDREKKKAADASLLSSGEPGCFLCRESAGDDGRQRLVVQRGQYSLTVLNRYPYNNGHLLVAPKHHLARLDQLDAAEQLDLIETMARMIELLERTIRAEGFNVGLNLGQVAGAGLPDHLHWHIVPRWHGDTNFMPTISGIRVIPQSLEALWEVLSEGLGGARPAEDAVNDS